MGMMEKASGAFIQLHSECINTGPLARLRYLRDCWSGISGPES